MILAQRQRRPPTSARRTGPRAAALGAPISPRAARDNSIAPRWQAARFARADKAPTRGVRGRPAARPLIDSLLVGANLGAQGWAAPRRPAGPPVRAHLRPRLATGSRASLARGSGCSPGPNWIYRPATGSASSRASSEFAFGTRRGSPARPAPLSRRGRRRLVTWKKGTSAGRRAGRGPGGRPAVARTRSTRVAPCSGAAKRTGRALAACGRCAASARANEVLWGWRDGARRATGAR